MKTGLGGRIRYRTTTSIALTAALALPLVLSGCEDHSPVAAPTSTLPAKDPTAASPAADPQPTIPAYETELDLSPEETEAVEGALVALDGYVATLNRVFESGGSETELDDEFAAGDALKALSDDSDDLRKQGQYMAGEFRLQSRKVNKIASDQNQISILSCVDNAAFAQVGLGEELPDSAPEPLTVEFVAKADGEVWKVHSQNLWSEQCAD
ncbi:hypothetical protein AAFP32_06675 [Brevibacterium sp. CBA3109]|uniref:Lipoprotein n=1 Tax=Brevibacterium koreense TaxID=3140787 RepID=A0AAU7UP57_9MICO